MDYKELFKKVIPHLAILLGFLVISVLYFSPILEGKKLPQMDNIHAKGMAQELVEFEKNNPGESSLWTNSMFGGLPSYQIKGDKPQNVFTYLLRFIRFKLSYTTIAIVFNYLIGFYILLLCFKVDKWISAIGALGFAFAAFNIIIISVGHITQAYAIAYMAPIIGGVYLVFRKKYIIGGIITLFFVGVQIATTHIQISYYTALLIAVMVIAELLYSLKNKEYSHLIKAAVVLLFCVILAVLPETKKLWTTYEYSKYSTRGGSVLESADKGDEKGLEKDYALAWSYEKMETFNLLIPNLYGGASGPLNKNTKTYDNLVKNGVQPQTAESIVRSTSAYWGNQPNTSGPVYFGAIIVFLFVLGIFIVNQRYRWWILVGTVLSILLAWGHNLQFFTDLFFEYIPLYNKFRTVSMILVIANLTVVLMAFLSLKEIYQGNVSKEKFKKSILYSLEIVGGVLLIFILFGGSIFNFEANSDMNLISQLQANNWPANLINTYREGVQEDRLIMLRSDAFRSFIFVLLAAGITYLFYNKKLKANYFIGALGLLILIDLWGVDKRYLNNDDFITSREEKKQFALTKADEQILKDTGYNNRVLNLTRDPFTDAYTPYYHQSIGGYHGAKLRRYQDLIERHLGPSIQNIARVLNSSGDISQVEMFLANQNALNMLNTKYIILSNDFVLTNKSAFGNAWFANEPIFLSTNNEIIKDVGAVNLREFVLIHDESKGLVEGNYSKDTIGANKIVLKSYKPNHLVYDVKAQKSGIAVFSEIYYPKGWNAYINGEKTKYFRANYILRAMVIPEGSHVVEFKFEPRSHRVGKRISLISSIIAALLLLSGIVVTLKKKNGLELE
ncbi:YfhO family protein [Bacteroidota bacterium]